MLLHLVSCQNSFANTNTCGHTHLPLAFTAPGIHKLRRLLTLRPPGAHTSHRPNKDYQNSMSAGTFACEMGTTRSVTAQHMVQSALSPDGARNSPQYIYAYILLALLVHYCPCHKIHHCCHFHDYSPVLVLHLFLCCMPIFIAIPLLFVKLALMVHLSSHYNKLCHIFSP